MINLGDYGISEWTTSSDLINSGAATDFGGNLRTTKLEQGFEAVVSELSDVSDVESTNWQDEVVNAVTYTTIEMTRGQGYTSATVHSESSSNDYITQAADGVFIYLPTGGASPGPSLGNNVDITTDFSKEILSLVTINFLLALCCVVLSLTVGYYIFRNRRDSFIQTLYLQNGLADFLVGVGVVLQCPVLCLLMWKGKELSNITVPVFISYYILGLGVRMSVFINCVLGVVRCINIARPFYHISKSFLRVCTLIYMFIWVSIIGIDIWQFVMKRGINNQVFLVKSLLMKGQPGFGLILLSQDKGDHGVDYLIYHLGNSVQILLPTALPTVLCFILMIVQLYHLSNRSADRQLMERQTTESSTEEGKMLSKAGVTILLLTVIYVATSAVSIVTWLIIDGKGGYLGSKSKYEDSTEGKTTPSSWSDLTAIYFSLSTCPLICSTLTPLTLLLRGTGPAFSSARGFFSKFRSSSRSSNETQT